MSEPGSVRRDDARAEARTRIRLTRMVLALIAVGVTLHFSSDHYGSLYDDAYIYFRFAKNVLGHCGLRWNCDDAPVEGFSSPLYLALLIGLHLLGRSFSSAATILGSVGVAIAIWSCGATIERSLRPYTTPIGSIAISLLAICAALALALDHFVMLSSVTGLETGLAMGAVGLIGWCALTDHDLTLPIVCAVLLRPEAAVFGVCALFAKQRRSLVLLLIAAITMTALRWWIFGTLLPNTFLAKAGGTHLHFVFGVEYLVECVRAFPVLALSPLALFMPELRRPIAGLLTAIAIWLLSFLETGGDHFAYARLAVPLVPLSTALTGIGLFAIARAIGRATSAMMSTLLGFLASAPFVALAIYVGRAHDLLPQHGFENVQRWQLLGQWLHDHHPGEPVATVPIGAIGYFSESPLIDLVGLTEPAIARAGRSVPEAEMRRGWIGHERHFTEWVLAKKPPLIALTKWRDKPWVSLDEARAGFWAEWLLLREVKEGRAPYAVLDAEIAPGAHWLLLKRRD